MSLQVIPESPQALTQALQILREGGIVAHATETCYGFACDLTNPRAVEKLFALKKRPTDQPVSALFPSVEEAKKYVKWNDEAEQLAKRHLPGPLTLILPLQSDVPIRVYPTPLTANRQPLTAILGLRLSSHPFAQRLAAAFGKPLSTTSANLHGQPNPYGAQTIAAQFKEEKLQPDLIIDSGVLPGNPPSTIIDLTQNNSRVVRKGTIEGGPSQPRSWDSPVLSIAEG